jgi:predicted ArsR family transcriptional regulator
MALPAPLGESEPDLLQRAARALGDPTRHRIFRHIAGAPGPVGVAELTDLLGLNHNAIRQHLAVLMDAELVVEEVEARRRPGRPRHLYRLNPEARGTWGTEGPYELLASLLSEALRSGEDPRTIGRRAGRRRAQNLRPVPDSLAALEEDLRASGFRPKRSVAGGGDGCCFVLGRCPFSEVASTDPDIVCQLHLGMVEGLVEEMGEHAEVDLVAEDPHRAGCRIALRPRRYAHRSRRPAEPVAAS